jgi:hypothetical protein
MCHQKLIDPSLPEIKGVVVKVLEDTQCGEGASPIGATSRFCQKSILTFTLRRTLTKAITEIQNFTNYDPL